MRDSTEMRGAGAGEQGAWGAWRLRRGAEPRGVCCGERRSCGADSELWLNCSPIAAMQKAALRPLCPLTRGCLLTPQPESPEGKTPTYGAAVVCKESLPATGFGAVAGAALPQDRHLRPGGSSLPLPEPGWAALAQGPRQLQLCFSLAAPRADKAEDYRCCRGAIIHPRGAGGGGSRVEIPQSGLWI